MKINKQSIGALLSSVSLLTVSFLGGFTTSAYAATTCQIHPGPTVGPIKFSSCINEHRMANGTWILQNDAYLTYVGGKINKNCFVAAQIVGGGQTFGRPAKTQCSKSWNNFHWYGATTGSYYP